MSAPRSYAGMAAMGNVLYVCGGLESQKVEDEDVKVF